MLYIDVGNTLFKFGRKENDGFHILFSRSSKGLKEEREFAFLTDLLATKEAVALSSVVPSITDSLVKYFKKHQHPYVFLTCNNCDPLVFAVDDKREVGSDLIADSLGAISLGEDDYFICDVGTATKCIYLSKKTFMGLSISPGLHTGLEGLLENAALLDLKNLKIPANPLGKNSEDCISGGLLYGKSYEILGFYEAYCDIANKPLKKILTGGDSQLLLPLLMDFEYHPTLLLEGLAYRFKEL